MAKYRKKPVEIEAIQYDGENISDLFEFVGDLSNLGIDLKNDKIYVITLEGDMEISKNDYLIRGIKGEYYPCKPDIFEASYDKI